jgi:hypothetical protein
MSRIVHELDPGGDVMLILRNPNAPFAVWDENVEPLAAPTFGFSDHSFLTLFSNKSKKKKKKKDKGGIPSFKSLDPGDGPKPPPEEPAPEEPPHEEPPHEDAPVPEDVSIHDATTAGNGTFGSIPEELPSEQEVEVRIRLSSKHLTLASTYFRKMLQGPWKESITSPDSCHTIDASEWDAEAMLILMNIIHGRALSVPRTISLEMLAKLAVLVDYYDCHEVVTLFAEVWVQNLEVIPKEYCRDLILWLVVSWVFSQGTHFETVTKVALKESSGPLQTLSLPIPQRIVGK